MRRECDCWPLKNRVCKTEAGLLLVQLRDGDLHYLCTIHLKQLGYENITDVWAILPNGEVDRSRYSLNRRP